MKCDHHPHPRSTQDQKEPFIDEAFIFPIIDIENAEHWKKIPFNDTEIIPKYC